VAWALDPANVELNPPAGVISNPLVWAIYIGDRHIGTVSIYNVDGPTAELGIIIGEEANRNRGYGTEAIRKAMSMCKANGFSLVHLKVLPSNAGAIRCYEKCGFAARGITVVGTIAFLLMDTSMKG
jgi:RimJ/RimL family protein N-acetyltransferase